MTEIMPTTPLKQFKASWQERRLVVDDFFEEIDSYWERCTQTIAAEDEDAAYEIWAEKYPDIASATGIEDLDEIFDSQETTTQIKTATSLDYDVINFTWTDQTVKVTLGFGVHRAGYINVVSGDRTGFDVLKTAVRNIYENLSKDDEGLTFVELIDSENDILTCADGFQEGLAWFESLTIAAEIIDIKPQGSK